MKGITIKKSALRDACKVAASAIKGKNIMQVLDNFLITLDSNKGLCLRASDTTIDIKIYVVTEAVDGEWEPCLLNMRMFTEMVDKFDGGEITMKQEAKAVAIGSGGCKGRLSRLPASEYPPEPDIGDTQGSHKISVENFAAAVGQVEHAASKNEISRHVLEMICIAPSTDAGAHIFALDGFRVERRRLDIPKNIIDPILLNAGKLSDALSALASSGVEEADMRFAGSWCAFDEEGKISIRLRRYDEKPINSEQLIKPISEHQTIIRLRRKEFLDAAQRTLLFSEKASSIVKVDISENAIMVHSSSKDGDITSTVDALVNKRGKLSQIAFNARYLIDCLRKGWSDADEIDIGLNTNVSPMTVRGVGADEMDVSLVLPVRVFG